MHIFRRVVLFSIFIMVLGSGLPAFAQPAGERISAKVVGVHDGDTITAITPLKEELKVRLGEIDAPELRQPFGQKSKQMLSDMVFGKEILIVKTDRDKYNRTVGRLYIGELDVNRTMAAQGGAWAYLKYMTDNSILEAQESAKEQKIGLWALQADQLTPPWEWRKSKRQGNEEADTDAPDTSVAEVTQDPGLWEPLPEEYPYASREEQPETTTENQTPSLAAPITQSSPAPSSSRCQTYCKSGKPCGDSCIAKNRNCTKPQGKAC